MLVGWTFSYKISRLLASRWVPCLRRQYRCMLIFSSVPHMHSAWASCCFQLDAGCSEYQRPMSDVKIHIYPKLFANAIVCQYFCPMFIALNPKWLFGVCVLCRFDWMDWDFVFAYFFFFCWFEWPKHKCNITECITFRFRKSIHF